MAQALARPAFHPKAQLLTARTERGRYANCRPRDAATLIILDHSAGALKMLMGKRHMGHKFMPGKFVFPGGRVEPKDYAAPSGFPMPVTVTARLLRALRGIAHPARARALLSAALRETEEETGLVIGASGEDALAAAPIFLARAITPPGRPRRFDTRFFLLPATAIAARTDIVDGEFSAIHWLTLDEARDADLPLITRIILDELEEGLANGHFADPLRPVPFYFKRGACFHRRLL